MKFAGSSAARFSLKPDPNCWTALVFGEDPGVVEDTAAQLIAAWTADDGEFEIITLEEDRVRREPAVLFDQLEARSLLGGDRLIRIRTSGDKLSALLLEAVKAGEEAPNRYAAKLLVLAGSLKKRSKLRTEYEAGSTASALHVFADEVGDISKLVTSSLESCGAQIEPAALQAFIGDLPGHRGLARTEIDKLVLFAHNLGRDIKLEDVRALSATAIDHAIGAIITATLDGQLADADMLLERATLAGTSPISILRAMQRDVQRMLHAHTLIAGSGDNNVGMKLRPPVWQNEWPTFRQRLSKWPPSHLARILERLFDVEQNAKSAGALAAPSLRTLIVNLSRAAANSRAA